MTTLPATQQPQMLQQFGFGDMERLAEAVARSGMFGLKTKEQALVLMAISQGEGRHPALAARDYDIIQGRPAKKAEAMQRDFMEAGGKIEWHALDDTVADATFSHPQGGSLRITWDMSRAKEAGLGGKEMWKKFPRQMLRSRVVSEGVRSVFPSATSGMYVPEEMTDVTPRPQPVVVPLKQQQEPEQPPAAEVFDPETGEVVSTIEPPYFLPVPKTASGQINYPDWGRTMIRALKAATTEQEVGEWIDKNAFTLSNCEISAPKAFASVTACAEARKRDLAEFIEE